MRSCLPIEFRQMNVDNNVICVVFLVNDKLYVTYKWSRPKRGTLAAFARNVQQVPR